MKLIKDAWAWLKDPIWVVAGMVGLLTLGVFIIKVVVLVVFVGLFIFCFDLLFGTELLSYIKQIGG